MYDLTTNIICGMVIVVVVVGGLNECKTCSGGQWRKIRRKI